MSFLSATSIAEIQAQIALKIEQLALANATYSELLQKQTEEYKFNSNEGSQSARRVKLNDIKDQIDSLEASIERLRRRLIAGGLVNVTLRR